MALLIGHELLNMQLVTDATAGTVQTLIFLLFLGLCPALSSVFSQNAYQL